MKLHLDSSASALPLRHTAVKKHLNVMLGGGSTLHARFNHFQLRMIFVLALDDLGLEIYESSSAAISACEGIDVEDGNYLFWDSAGQALQPHFLRSNTRGRFAVFSGEYELVPAPGLTRLLDSLDQVAYFEEDKGFGSLHDLATYLKAQDQSDLT